MPKIKLSVNVNDQINIKLTEHGHKVYMKYLDSEDATSRHLDLPIHGIRPAVGDVVKLQLWQFANIFGPTMGIGDPPVTEHNVFYMTDLKFE